MRSQLALILTVAGKDWQLFWADRRAAVLCFLVPIILASAFGLIFNRPVSSGETVKLPVAIVVEDDGSFTRQLANELLASPRLEAVELSRAEATRLVAERRPGVAIILTNGTERMKDCQTVPSDARPTVELLHNPASAAERQWAVGVLTEVVMKKLARDRFAGLLGDSALAPPFRVSAAPVTDPSRVGFNAYSHSFCGMTLQYLLFWGMESGLLLLRERQQRGLWHRLRASPVSLGVMLVGKSLATAGIGLLLVIVTFGFGYLAFGVTIGGSSIGFVLLALAASGLAAATGLLVAALGGTEARARSVCILLILGVSMFGGLWLPSFLLPGWIREVALSLPTTWAMRGLDAVTWQGRGLASAMPSVLAVTGFTLLLLGIAVARMASSESRHRRGLA